MYQSKNTVSILGREIVILYPDNYQQWAESVKKRSYQHGEAGKLIREFNISIDSYLNGKVEEENYLLTNGGAALMTDLLTSISRDSEIKLKTNPGYKRIETEGKFMHLWELIQVTHVQRKSSLVLMRSITGLKQERQSLEEYIIRFETLLDECRNHGEPISESQSVCFFLNGLSDYFQNVIESWELNGIIPKSYLAAKERVMNAKKILGERRGSRNMIPSRPDENHKGKRQLKCFKCGKLGHKAYECKDLKTEKQKGSINFCGAVLLDSGANVSMCNDKKALHNLEEESKHVTDINGVTKTINEKGIFMGIKDVLYHEDCPAQILSFGQIISQGHKIDYNSKKDQFKVKIENKDITFGRNSDSNLYSMIEDNILMADDSNSSIGVSVQKEIEKLHCNLGHPCDRILEDTLEHLPETKIKKGDIKKYRDSKGPCAKCLAGKMTENIARSHDHHPDAKIGEFLHCDIMFTGVSKRKFIFLVVVDHKTGYINSIQLNDKTSTSVYVALEAVVDFYKSFGHKVETVYFDQDCSIKGAEDRINQLEINLVLRAPFRHERRVERYIRTLKDTTRTIMMNLGNEEDLDDYEFLVPEAVAQASRLINIRSNSKCSGSYPRLLVTKIPIKERELEFAFGDRGVTKARNQAGDLSRRSEDVIYIGSPPDTLGYRVYSVSRQQFLDRHDFQKVSVMAYNDIKETAIEMECENMLKNNVFSFVKVEEVNKNKCIGSFIFGKQKINADGSPGKYKARMVARGDQQGFNNDESFFAETIDKKSLFAIMNVALQKNWKFATADVPSAFLHAKINEEQYMRLSKDATKYYLSRDQTLKEKLDEKGNLYVLLKKSLYGLRQAAKLWNDELNDTLLSFGLIKSVTERAMFYNYGMYLMLHVDDIIVFYQNKHDVEKLSEALKKYGNVIFNFGDKQQYLGMEIVRTSDKYCINQKGFIENLVDGIKETRKYPIFSLTPKEDGEGVDKNKYLSLLMKIMYVAKATRPDLVFACSYFGSFSQAPKKVHMNGLINMLYYINGCKNFQICIGMSNEIEVFCDASFNLHADNKGHSGCVIRYGGSVFWMSKKQKIVTSSAFESEFICLYNTISYVLELVNFLNEIGMKPIVKFFEDNNAVISVLRNGTGVNGSTKHLNVKINYVKQIFNEYNFSITYMSSKEMIADLLTKPLSGGCFYEMRRRIFG